MHDRSDQKAKVCLLHVVDELVVTGAADAIVLGTHGRGGLSRVVMGSDAEMVLRETPVPVLLLRSPLPSPERRARRA